MNINIYSFSNNIDFNIYPDEISFQKNQRISSYTVLNNNNNNNYFNNNHHHMNTNIKSLNFKLPNSKKIAKLVKIINLNFPDFSIDDIINYLIPDNKYLNSITKINEIKNIFFFQKSNQNKIILSSMVRDTIKGISIQTPKSLISSFCPCESILENNSYKNSDIFQPTNKKYLFPIKDDYKFQTISTNEKDNNKNNPFIIYVCDNVPKINFNENQNNFINNDSTLNKNDNNENNIYYSKTENNQENKNRNEKFKEIKNNNLNNNNDYNPINNNNLNKNYYNPINNNKSKILNKDNLIQKRKSLDTKKQLKLNKHSTESNNAFLSNNKKKLKIQRISTDVRDKIKKGKFNSLTGVKYIRNKVRDSNVISNTNIIIENNIVKRKLNKSIESHNNYTAKCRLSKTSEISQRRKQNQKNNNNNTLLINRMNKKDSNNPFFKTDS